VGKGRGLKIDVEHPVTQAYIDEKRRNTKQNEAKAPATASNSVPQGNKKTSLVNESGEVIDLEDLTVRQVAMDYGGLAEFNGYVKALKDIATYKKTEQEHLHKRGELIDRASTAATLFSLVDVAYKRLVSEMPDAVIQQLIPLIQSGGDEVERDGRALLVKSVSKILKDCKTEISKRLQDLDKSGG
jgi:hypothetical protein